MRYADILKEASVPLTDYGYWVSPTGAIHPVERHDHHDIIKKLSGQNPAEAMINGWGRVIAEPGAMFMEVECCSTITRQAISSIQRIAAAEDFMSFMLDFHKDGEMMGRRFDTINALLLFIRENKVVSESIRHSPLEQAILSASRRLSWRFDSYASDPRALDDLYDAMQGDPHRPRKKLELRHAVEAMVMGKRHLA